MKVSAGVILTIACIAVLNRCVASASIDIQQEMALPKQG